MTRYDYIPDEWIVSYAAGTLTDAEALVVASHIAYHPALQARLADAEAIGGALLESMEAPDTLDTSFDRLMARIDAEGTRADVTAPPLTSDTDLPDVLRTYLDRPLNEMKWRIMGPGMYQCQLAKGADGEKLWLLRAKGGTEMPVHDHRGMELTLILRGSYCVGDKRYGPGSLEFADASVTNHQPIIDPGEDCICLVVTDAPIRLHSFMGRLLQPLIGL